MKRLLTIGLAAALLLSVMLVGSLPVSAEKNQCETFEILRSYLLEFNTGSTPKTEFTASDMGYWVRQQYDSVYSDRLQGEWESGVFTESEEGLYTAYPAAHFESIAHRLFDFEGTLRDKLQQEAEPYAALVYDEKNDRFVWTAGGKGGIIYEQQGYTVNADGTYAVYYRTGDPDENEDYAIVWKDGYIRLQVQLDEPLVKVLKTDLVQELPAAGLITPGTVLPDVRYEADEGIRIDGDRAFPADTLVQAKKLEGEQVPAAVKTALEGVAADGKLVAFDITAKSAGNAVQPNGKVTVTFAIPSALSAENLKLYYVAEDGTKEEIAITVNGEAKTVTAELTHFSLYVLCNAPAAAGGAATPPMGESVRLVAIIAAVALIAAVICIFTVTKKRSHKD